MKDETIERVSDTLSLLQYRKSARLVAPNSAVLLSTMSFKRSDYYVVTSRCGVRLDVWRWEIRRKGKYMGVKLCGEGYRSDQAARLAGKEALDDLMLEMARTESREEMR